jgi:glucose/arabinose dehydrogenase
VRERNPWGIGAALAALALAAVTPSTASATVTDAPFGQSPTQRVAALAAVPTGFQDTVAFSGLTMPVAVRFAPDGAVFVAEKRGTVQRYDSVSDATPQLVADVRGATHDFWDRGLIGLAVDPGYPARPYVYISYAYDAGNSWSDGCPTPPGPTEQGCVVAGRISRVNANTRQETVLVEDFCQQFPSHSVGGLAFGADGQLYASAGDGASFNYADERPTASRPDNPCGDPPREGGSIRSQDLRTSGDPVGLDGSILRLDPNTPLSAGAKAQAIVAQGLRNPFRLAVRPGTNEVWAGDVGWNKWEEINRLTDPASRRNFGWPCYEGGARMGTWDALNNPVCEGLYTAGADPPYYAYDHGAKVVANESCPTGTSSISGLAFYAGGTFPAEYDGALFFADYARKCVWAMLRGSNGLPDPAQLRTFITNAAVVDVQVGPGGDLYYVDIGAQTVRRVRATNGNTAPTARASATPDRGPLPLDVTFDGRGSTDPNPGTTLSYAWDLDLDGQFDDGAQPVVTRQFTASGTYRVRLRVRDPSGLDDVAEAIVYAGVPPQATIAAPGEETAWRVGDTLSFSGSGRSATGAALPAGKLSWQLDLHHCPGGGCHVHPIQTWVGVTSGSFVAPDHEYPSYLELRLTATDGGLSTTVSRTLQPRTSALRVASEPPGFEVFAGSESGPAPLDAEVIVGSTTSIGAAIPQQRDGLSWAFTGWPEPGEPSRDVVAGEDDSTYTAHFRASDPPPGTGAPPADQPPAEPPPSGGVAGWEMEGGALRLHGARRAGRGLVFDGAGDSATIAARPLRLRSAFTVAARVRPARGSGRAPLIVGERRRSTAFALGAQRGATRWRGPLRVNARLPAGRSSYVALTWDGRMARLYVNGRPAGRHAAKVKLGRVLRMRLGGDPRARRWFRGRLDSVRVLPRALPPHEVAALRNGGH